MLVKLDHLPQIFGVKIPIIFELPPPKKMDWRLQTSQFDVLRKKELESSIQVWNFLIFTQKHGEKPTGYELHAKVHIVSVWFPTPLKGFLK